MSHKLWIAGRGAKLGTPVFVKKVNKHHQTLKVFYDSLLDFYKQSSDKLQIVILIKRSWCQIPLIAVAHALEPA